MRSDFDIRHHGFREAERISALDGKNSAYLWTAHIFVFAVHRKNERSSTHWFVSAKASYRKTQ